MNKILLVGVIASTLLIQGCQPKQAAQADTAPVTLDSSGQKISYGIAYGLGQRLKMDDIPVDLEAFSAGLEDALSGGASLMTDEQMASEMAIFQAAQNEKMEVKMQGISSINEEAAVAFFARNGAKEGVVTLDSGLQYKVLETADGDKPGAADTVEVHYRGVLLDDSEFDSSYSRGQPATFGVGQVIPGWTEALQLMSVGSKWQIYIPSDLGYGPGGAGPKIGPNAALIFDVELLSIVKK